MSSSFKQKKMKTLVTRKKTRKRRMEAGMTHDDDSGRLFQPPSQRDPRWKKPSAHDLVRATAAHGSSNERAKRQKLAAHNDDSNDDVDDDEDDFVGFGTAPTSNATTADSDDGFDVVAGAPDSSDEDETDAAAIAAAAAFANADASQSDADEYDDDNTIKHPLQFCTSIDDCIARGAALHQRIRKLDGRQKTKVLLLVETSAFRKGLKAKLQIKQELVKSKSRVGIRSVKSNSMAYKHIAILKTPLVGFKGANAPMLQDFRTGKVPSLLAEDTTFYPYADLKINHVVFLAKTAAAAVNLDRKLLKDLQLNVFVVADESAKTTTITPEQRTQLAKLYEVQAEK